jgi:hypothetical protein
MHGLLLLLPSKAGMIAFSVGFQTSVQAQETIELNTQNLHFVVAGGANFNFYRGSTTLNASFTSPKTFHDGLDFSLHRF